MSTYKDLKNEIESLIEMGGKMYSCFVQYTNTDNLDELTFFLANYEKWYTSSLILVSKMLPQRFQDFKDLYINQKRKKLTSATYTISDALRGIGSKNSNISISDAALPLHQQKEIVESCGMMLDSHIYNMQTLLQADIFDSEIESAKHLLKRGFLRAAGAICGVVIEKHFCDVCNNHNITITKKNPTIADYNDKLKDNVYDTIEWRRIQRLGDLRNLCDHNKDREPTNSEVEELIVGTERVIKTIF